MTATTVPAPIPLLEVENLAIAYRDRGHEQRVVHGVSFAIAPGEVVALVGESGSGKTTTAQALIGLLADNGRVEQGAIRLNGTDIAAWSPDRFDTVRGRVISLIPQDPTSSLNPVRTVGEQVGEILKTMSNFYNREVAVAVDSLVSLIEPAMIVGLGSGVAVLLAAVLVPIYSIASSTG